MTFADNGVLTAAMLDRLTHHAHVIQIKGAGNRLKDKRRAGMPEQAETEPACS
jgi:DNA replication protein DnaC